ncbi:MAG TPA: hypothetical protein VFE22_02250, partial [Edaphobacter sp.]|nr:hypothetical protein [Edaphobacter sp.]
LCTAPIMLPFAYANHAARGENAWLVTMIILAVIRIRWELRSQTWFWIVVVLIGAAHIPIILCAPWTNSHYLGYAMAPLIFIDFAAVYGVVKLVEISLKRGL